MPLRARNRLVVEHLHIVGAATAQLASRVTQVPRDDLTSAGAYALVRAADRYDSSLGVPFGAFARDRINWALKDELRSLDWAPREVRAGVKAVSKARERLTASLGRTPTVAEIAQVMDVAHDVVRERLADADRVVASLDAPDVGEFRWTGDLPDEVVIASERDEFLHRAVDALPERKRFVIRAIYFDDRTVKDVAVELGVSHAAVSQQRSEAVRMLRDAVERFFREGAVAVSPRSRMLDAYLERISAGRQRSNPSAD
ncbi:sigma-70 family RNA polymerase sigma factor [Microbacterium sp. EST19A]|uniref:sigma-70 family RNA polymerase sigma factor n=1 Tax=Microbacterium sp. EST19A TaxID=2862681 RepID=UPI001CC113EB|nr:sigma-70 family RNA polymerase sigma factor [Microbacterium sp. EST19A]